MEKSFYLDFIANSNSNTNPIVIYIAVGCAAHQIQKDKDEMWILPENKNQEYPLFLQILKSKFPSVNLHIFMIDPLLEDIPFVISSNKEYKEDKKTLKNNWYQLNSEMFYNQKENTTIYAIKDYVVYPYDKFEDKKKYNIFFEKLNNYAKQLNWTVFFCDFSGRSIRDSAIYFEKEIKNHHDHIIYGFLADDENISTCNIDTTSPECLYLLSLSKENNKIQVFNPYMYDENYYEELPKYLDAYHKNKEDLNIASIQIKNFLRYKKRYIKNIMYSLRAIYVGIQKKEKINDYHITGTSMLAEKYEFKFYLDFDENNYKNMFDSVKKIFLQELEKYVKILFFDDAKELVYERYNAMIKDENAYNWEKYISDILVDYDKIF
jgi:hypothetical protein